MFNNQPKPVSILKNIQMIFSRAYSQANWNGVKMVGAKLIDLLNTGINLVAPVIISEIVTKKVVPPTSPPTNNSPEFQLAYEDYFLIGAASLIVLSKLLPKARYFLLDSVRLNVQKQLTKEMAEKAFELELDHHLSERTGDFSQALQKNYTSIDSVIPNFFGEMLPTYIDIAAIGGYMIYRFGSIGLFLPSVTIVHQIINFLLEKRSAPLRQANVREGYIGYGTLLEAVSNYQIAHQFGNVKHEMNKVIDSLTITENSNKKVHYFNNRKSIFLSMVNTSGLLGTLAAFFILQPSNRTFTAKVIENAILYIYFSMYMNAKLEFLPNAVSLFYAGAIDAQKVQEFLSKKSKINDVPNAIPLFSHNSLEVEFKNVNFTYQNKKILENISFKINSGEKIAVVGPTGAGKSTLIKLLFRFYKLDEFDGGQILINGNDINQYTLKSLRNNLGIVSQDTILFKGTVSNNIAYGDLNADHNDILNALKYSGFEFNGNKEEQDEIFLESESKKEIEKDEIFVFDKNQAEEILNRDVGQQGSKLSGGEKQRVGIARALLKSGNMLCLDEPTASLDVKTESKIQNTLDEITSTAKITTLLITHRLHTTINADKILYLEDGKIVEEGTFEELANKDNGKFNGQLLIQCNELGLDIKDIKPSKKIEFSKSTPLTKFWNNGREKLQQNFSTILHENSDSESLNMIIN